jgi:hypothetical protein
MELDESKPREDAPRQGTLAPRSKRIHERSGSVETDDPWIVFLYLLMRDEVPVGVVGRFLREISDTSFPVKFCNGWLATYAVDVAAQLTRRARPRHKNGTKCLDDDLPLGPCELPHMKRLTQAEQAEVLLALQGTGLHERVREHFLLEDLERGA